MCTVSEYFPSSIYVRSKADGRSELSLAHGTKDEKRKNKKKLKTKTG